MAFGPLNLKPHEFWELTMGEFEELLEGYRYRERREWEKTAQLAAWIMSPHMKRRISGQDLLKKDGQQKKTTPEETKEVMDDLISRLGKGVNIAH